MANKMVYPNNGVLLSSTKKKKKKGRKIIRPWIDIKEF